MNNIPAHNKTYRVVQWAAGRIGQSAMRAVIGHPNLELVGVFVHSEEKDGRDAGELCGLDPIGVGAGHDDPERLEEGPWHRAEVAPPAPASRTLVRLRRHGQG